MIIFSVCSYNLDLPGEGVHITSYHREEVHAISAIDTLITKYGGEDRIEDLDGKLSNVEGKSLRYLPCGGKKAVYYHSHYGKYNCCYFIDLIEVY